MNYRHKRQDLLRISLECLCTSASQNSHKQKSVEQYVPYAFYGIAYEVFMLLQELQLLLQELLLRLRLQRQL